MNCPFCRIATMRKVPAGDVEIDRCLACGALWFDAGEIRELAAGRVPGEAGDHASAPEPPPDRRAALRAAHAAASRLSCPGCGARLGAVDFRATGIPVLACRSCRGVLAPRSAAAALDARFRRDRENGDRYRALGEAMAGTVRERMERALGPSPPPGGAPLPLPVVVPLADDAPDVRTRPWITLALLGLLAVLYVVAAASDAPPRLPGGGPGLPPGTGLSRVTVPDLLAAPFLHAGIVPLAASVLFLFVLGDNVEDRMGRLPFLLLFLASGACASAAHLFWGRAGGPPALGAGGAVGGILGAYLVFFPQVSVRGWGPGGAMSVPAYVFACTWMAAAFLVGPGPFADWLNPAPLSLPGNVAGFAAGAAGAILFRLREDAGAANRGEGGAEGDPPAP